MIRKNLVKGLTVALLLSSTGVQAASTSDLQKQLDELKQQVALIQRQLEVEQEKSVANAEKFGSVEVNNKGLNVTGADKGYGLRLRGNFLVDGKKYINDKRGNNVDEFMVRSARPILEVKIPHDISGRIAFDYGNGQSRLIDTYVDWKPTENVTLRVGKFKSPVGFERWGGEAELLFVERGLPTNLAPNRDIGIGAFGEIIPQTLEYQFSITNGVADLGDANSDTGGGKDFNGRIFTQPFKNTDINYLQGLGVGIAGSAGQRGGNTTNTELTSGYRSTAQNNVFTYTSGTFADGKHTRLNPHGWYYNGPLGIVTEYIASELDVTRATNHATLKNDAWTFTTSYVLTGEDASFDGVKPRRGFDPEKGDWGAFEIAGRISKLNVDERTFPTFASITTAVKQIDEKVIGLNWYLNQNVKLNLNYSKNTFEGGAAGGNDRPDEDVYLGRVQLKF